MPRKLYSKTGSSCRVHFELPADVAAKKVSLLGDFNEWNPKTHVLKKKKDGSFWLDVYLTTGATYRYKFLLDGKRWENDWDGEAYLPNEHGTEDSAITV